MKLSIRYWTRGTTLMVILPVRNVTRGSYLFIAWNFNCSITLFPLLFSERVIRLLRLFCLSRTNAFCAFCSRSYTKIFH
jgi:hypothetical protein